MAEPITISGETLLEGMSDSKFLGVQEIRNLDIFSKKGIIRIAYKSTAESGGDVPTSGFIKHAAIDLENGDTYFADDTTSTTIYKRSGGGNWTTISGATSAVCRGLIIFKDYLFRVYVSGGATKLDRYGPLSGSPSWSTNWVNLSASISDTYVPSIVGQDDVVYFGVDNNVIYLADPTVATVNVALDLPSGYEIQSFAELGANLMIGATFGSTIASVGDIFPWDRTSSSFKLPIQTGLPGVPIMYTKNNILYAICGNHGTLISTNGSGVVQSQRLAGFTDDPEVSFRSGNYGATDAWNGGVLFGLGKSASSVSNGPVGVWFIRDGAWQYFSISAGDGSNTGGLDIGAIIGLNDFSYLVTWRDLNAGTYGIDVVDTTRRTGSYNAYAISKFYTVGTNLQPRTFQRMQFQLANPLEANQGIKISYRIKPSDNFTDIDTFAYGDASGSDNANLGAITSFEWIPDIPPCQIVQFKISLTTGNTNDATPELLYVNFI